MTSLRAQTSPFPTFPTIPSTSTSPGITTLVLPSSLCSHHNSPPPRDLIFPALPSFQGLIGMTCASTNLIIFSAALSSFRAALTPLLSPGLSSHGFRGSAVIAEFKGARRVVFSVGSWDSRREVTDEMSRVSPANMFILRALGRMSEMVRAPVGFSGPLPPLPPSSAGSCTPGTSFIIGAWWTFCAFSEPPLKRNGQYCLTRANEGLLLDAAVQLNEARKLT